MAFCSKCGTAVQPNDKFCQKCGLSNPSLSAETEKSVQMPQNVTQNQPKRNKTGLEKFAVWAPWVLPIILSLFYIFAIPNLIKTIFGIFTSNSGGPAIFPDGTRLLVQMVLVIPLWVAGGLIGRIFKRQGTVRSLRNALIFSLVWAVVISNAFLGDSRWISLVLRDQFFADSQLSGVFPVFQLSLILFTVVSIIAVFLFFEKKYRVSSEASKFQKTYEFGFPILWALWLFPVLILSVDVLIFGPRGYWMSGTTGYLQTILLPWPLFLSILGVLFSMAITRGLKKAAIFKMTIFLLIWVLIVTLGVWSGFIYQAFETPLTGGLVGLGSLQITIVLILLVGLIIEAIIHSSKEKSRQWVAAHPGYLQTPGNPGYIQSGQPAPVSYLVVCPACKARNSSVSKYCGSCAAELPVVPEIVVQNQNPIGTARLGEPVSGAMWLLPIFLGVTGGLIAWVISRDQNPNTAKNMLICGLLMGVVLPIVVYGLYFLYLYILIAGA